MKSIPENEFWKEVAMAAGLSDMDTVKRVYYGMVKVMSRQLRARQVIQLPDWGEFRLKIHKSRKFMDVTTGAMGILPPKPTVKWSPHHAVKKYFHALGEVHALGEDGT